MGRFETERQNFIRAYTRLLVSSWSDDLYLQRLLASPRDVLAEAGLEFRLQLSFESRDRLPQFQSKLLGRST